MKGRQQEQAGGDIQTSMLVCEKREERRIEQEEPNCKTARKSYLTYEVSLSQSCQREGLCIFRNGTALVCTLCLLIGCNQTGRKMASVQIWWIQSTMILQQVFQKEIQTVPTPWLPALTMPISQELQHLCLVYNYVLTKITFNPKAPFSFINKCLSKCTAHQYQLVSQLYYKDIASKINNKFSGLKY